MEEIAVASINTFGMASPKADFVPPSEDPVFILTSRQLQDLITKALQPLQDRVKSLEAIVTHQSEKIAALEATEPIAPIFQEIQGLREENIKARAAFESFKKSHCSFAIRTTNEIDQLFAAMEKNPQPLQKDRGEILRALLAANEGKLLRSQARKKMHLSESRFSELLATMTDYIEVRPYHLNKNQKVLVLRRASAEAGSLK